MYNQNFFFALELDLKCTRKIRQIMGIEVGAKVLHGVRTLKTFVKCAFRIGSE